MGRRLQRPWQWSQIAMGALVLLLLGRAGVVVAQQAGTDAPGTQPPTGAEQKVLDAMESIEQADLPQPLKPCIPDGVRSVRLDASVSQGKSTYFHLGLRDSVYWSSIFEVQGNRCRQLIPKAKNGKFAWSRYVDRGVARKLALESYRTKIELVGGRRAFQESLKQNFYGIVNPSLVTEEKLWALRELGFSLPKENAWIVPVTERGPQYDRAIGSPYGGQQQ